MLQPYTFELEVEYPDVFKSLKLPVAVVMVTVNGKFCSNAGISERGALDTLLPENTYWKLRAGKAKILFPTLDHQPDEPGQLVGIEILDAT